MSIDIVEKVIYVICNISFRTGVFPSRIKITKVILLFKSGAKTELFNFSLAAHHANQKVFEKRFLDRIDSFVTPTTY